MIVTRPFTTEKFPNFNVRISFSTKEFKKYRQAIEWCVNTYGTGDKMDSWILNIDRRLRTNRWAWQTDSGYYIYLNDKDLAWFLVRWG